MSKTYKSKNTIETHKRHPPHSKTSRNKTPRNTNRKKHIKALRTGRRGPAHSLTGIQPWTLWGCELAGPSVRPEGGTGGGGGAAGGRASPQHICSSSSRPPLPRFPPGHLSLPGAGVGGWARVQRRRLTSPSGACGAYAGSPIFLSSIFSSWPSSCMTLIEARNAPGRKASRGRGGRGQVARKELDDLYASIHV